VADSVLSASATSAPADGTSVVTVTAQLNDANGAAVAGKTVALNLQGAGHSVVTTVTGVTDQNGLATFTVTDTTVETVTYTAKDVTDNLPIANQSVTISFTTPTATTSTTTAGTTTTTSTGSSNSSGSTGAATAANGGTVGASSGQLALTGSPSLLPWLVGFGLFLLVCGSLGRRLLGPET
jgi:adhesin/invasin